MTRIALVSPSARSMSDRPPLHFMYMSSYLEAKGIDAELIDIKGYTDKAACSEEILKRIGKSKAEFVGFSATSPEVKEVKALATETKNLLGKDVTTVVGGTHATVLPEDFLKDSDIDFVLQGEGEKGFYNLITAENKKELKGVSYFNGDGTVHRSMQDELIDVNELPPLNYEKIDIKFYTKPTIYCIRGIPISGFYLFTARGCSFKCTYCANPMMFGSEVRYFTPQRIVNEIEILKNKYKVDGIFFYDDTFTMSREHVTELCDEIIKRKIKFLWGCQTRANMINKEMLQKMRAAGCVQMEFGVETGSDRMLRVIKKGVNAQNVKDAFKMCKEAGMKRFANFMFNLPTETLEDLQQTVQLAREIKPEVSIFNVTIPFPGSPMYGSMPMQSEDYDRFNSNDYIEMLEFINTKYNMANYDGKNLMQIEQELIAEFPSIHNIKFNAKTLGILWSNVSFLMSPTYLGLFASSKRKTEYINYWLNFGKILKSLKREAHR